MPLLLFGFHDQVFRAIGKTGDVAVALFGDHENVVLTIAASTRKMIRDCDHRLHGDHHAGFENNAPAVIEAEKRLTAGADLLIVSDGEFGCTPGTLDHLESARARFGRAYSTTSAA